jgi:hypothetical protein
VVVTVREEVRRVPGVGVRDDGLVRVVRSIGVAAGLLEGVIVGLGVVVLPTTKDDHVVGGVQHNVSFSQLFLGDAVGNFVEGRGGVAISKVPAEADEAAAIATVLGTVRTAATALGRSVALTVRYLFFYPAAGTSHNFVASSTEERCSGVD